MAFWNRRKAEPPRAIPPTEWVEEIIAQLQAKPPSKPLCLVPLKKGYPVTETPFFSQVSKEEDLSVYLSAEAAPNASHVGFDAMVGVGDAAELWALLNNPRKNGRGAGLYDPPYGLSVNYNYFGESPGYVRYGKEEIQRIGLEGLARGFNRSGELKEGFPERVQFPVCMICGKPSPFAGTGFHCISCDFTGTIHDKCLPGRNPFGGSVFTIGGGGLRCPRCGATG